MVRILSPAYNLAVIAPHVAEQWHPLKNGDLRPLDVTPSSGKRVWWRCAENHEWQATIASRTAGRGCRVCSRVLASKKRRISILQSSGSLLMSNSALAEQWHPKLNGGLGPNEVSAGSNMKVWWRCGKGHDWRASISNRAKGRGCPYCAGRQVSEENRLTARFPQVAREWHPNRNGSVMPSQVSYGSTKTYWWQCSKGHEWRASVNGRTSKAGYCPECFENDRGKLCVAGHIRKRGSLAERYPRVASEWDSEKNTVSASEVSSASDMNGWWNCGYGHTYQSRVYLRTLHGAGCPQCRPSSSRFEIRIYTELKNLLDKVRWRAKINKKEVDVYLDEYHLGIEYDGKRWHKNSIVRDRDKNAKLQAVGVSLIRVRDSELGKIANDDLTYERNSDEFTLMVRLVNKIIAHIKKQGYASREVRKLRRYAKGSGLVGQEEYSQLVFFLPGPEATASLKALHPEIAAQWDYERNRPLIPERFHPSSNVLVWWKCVKGHAWRTSVAKRTVGRNCPYCSNKIVGLDNNLLHLFPQLAAEWNYRRNHELTPDRVVPGSNRKVWWVCQNDHEWEATVASRVRGNGCLECSKRTRGISRVRNRIASHGSLSDNFQGIAQQWHPTRNGDLTANDVTPGIVRRVWWLCEEGHEWHAVVRKRVAGQGCRLCRRIKRKTLSG